MLEVKVGELIELLVQGHSAINGAPVTGTMGIENNGPDVVDVPTSVEVPVDGQQTFHIPATIKGPGSADAHVTVTDAKGVLYEATASITVTPVEPGLLFITAEFVKLEPVP